MAVPLPHGKILGTKLYLKVLGRQRQLLGFITSHWASRKYELRHTFILTNFF